MDYRWQDGSIDYYDGGYYKVNSPNYKDNLFIIDTQWNLPDQLLNITYNGQNYDEYKKYLAARGLIMNDFE